MPATRRAWLGRGACWASPPATPADFAASEISFGLEAGGFVTRRFTLSTPTGAAPLALATAGAHNAANALAAAAAASRRRRSASTTSSPASPRSARRRSCSSSRDCAAGSSTTRTTPIRARRALASRPPRPRRRRGPCSARWRSSADAAIAAHADIGAYAAAAAWRAPPPVGPTWAHASFGAGAEWFADVDACSVPEHELPAEVDAAGQGLAVNRPRAGRRGARTAHGTSDELAHEAMLLLLTEYLRPASLVLPRVPVPDAARHPRGVPPLCWGSGRA